VETSDSLSVKVFRPDDDEATAKPFFEATLKPFRYLPAIPFSIKVLSWFLSTDLVLPPLPSSDRPGDEVLCSTEHWKRSSLGFYARKMRLMWSEVSTPAVRDGDGKRGNGESDAADGDVESGSNGWWPFLQDVEGWTVDGGCNAGSDKGRGLGIVLIASSLLVV
jgi:hypothetical protein